MTFEEYIATLDWTPTKQQAEFIAAYDEAVRTDGNLIFSGARCVGKTDLLRRLEEYWSIRPLTGHPEHV